MVDESITQDAADVEAVIRKIRKILAKKDRGATDEEMDAAMGIVQGLMAKYNLDMATVDAAGESASDVGSVRVDETSDTRVRFKWQQSLARYVAEANFCLHVLVRERVRDVNGNIVWIERRSSENEWGYYREGTSFPKRRLVHRFIGRKANVVTTRLMFDYLCDAISESLPNRGPGLTKAAASWLEGCAAKVCERLAERRADLMAEHDAKVKEQEAAFAAEMERRRAQAEAKRLGPRPPTAEEIAADLGKGAYDAVGLGSRDVSEPVRPEVRKDDWTPGAGAEAEPEDGPPVTTLVLASVYDDRERELNEDLLYGLPPGTTTKRRLEREAEEREWEREEAEREKAEAAAAEDEAPAPVETERQRQAREKREAKEWAEQRRRWAREDAREERKARKEWMRLDHSAYKAGMRTGEKIGLDPQVKAKKDSKRLEGGR